MTKKKEVDKSYIKTKTIVNINVKNQIEKAIYNLQEIYQKCQSLQYSIDGLGAAGYDLGAQLAIIKHLRTEAEIILYELIE